MVASTNSSNSLRFLQVEMNKMSEGINGDVNNKDCGTFLTQYEALRRRTWPEKTKRLVVACSRAAITEYQLIQVDNDVKQSKEAKQSHDQSLTGFPSLLQLSIHRARRCATLYKVRRLIYR